MDNLYEIGEEVELLSEKEADELGYGFVAPLAKKMLGESAVITEIHYDEWNSVHVYQLESLTIKMPNGYPANFWFDEDLIRVNNDEMEEIEVKGQMLVLASYIDAFFKTKQIKGKINGTVQSTHITTWSPLFQIEFFEREEGEVLVTIRERIKDIVLYKQPFKYVGEENVLVPEINSYLESKGVI